MEQWFKTSEFRSWLKSERAANGGRFIVLQSITQSREIRDGQWAWLESWIPHYSGSALECAFLCCLLNACSELLCLFVCQRRCISVYTSCADQCQSLDNHQLHEGSRGGDSAPRHGLLQHLKPGILRFDTVCLSVLLAALWLSLLPFVRCLFNFVKLGSKVSNSRQRQIVFLQGYSVDLKND